MSLSGVSMCERYLMASIVPTSKRKHSHSLCLVSGMASWRRWHLSSLSLSKSFRGGDERSHSA